MLSKNIIVLTTLFFFASCASVNNQYSAEPEKYGKNKDETQSGLHITAEEDKAMSSRYIGLINVTFENRSDKWLHLKNLRLDFGSEQANKHVSIISGRNIIAWHEAIQQRNQINDFNQSLFLESLFAAGLVTVAVAGDSKAGIAGAATAAAAVSLVSIEDYNRTVNRLERPRLFPKNHLLSDDIIVPPGLFSKHWLLLSTEKHNMTNKIDSFLMTYNTSEGNSETVKVKFRNAQYTSSKWQDDIFLSPKKKYKAP